MSGMTGRARDRSRSPVGVPMSTEEISSSIIHRERSRQAKDFSQADAIRENLRRGGVTLFDDTHHWRTEDGRSGSIPTWVEIEAGDQGLTSVPQGADISTIKDLVQQREECRARKDYEGSDALRAQLKATGVEIFDKEQMWRGRDGLCGVVLSHRGPGTLPTDVEITTLVAQREKFKQNHDWATCDVIREELQARGVHIIDRERKWTARDGRVGVVPRGGVGPTVLPVQATHGMHGVQGVQSMHGMPMMHGMQRRASYPPVAEVPAVLAGLTMQQIYAMAAAAVQNNLVPGTPMVGHAGMGQHVSPPQGMRQQMSVQTAPLGGIPVQAAVSQALQNAVGFCSSTLRMLRTEEITWLVEVRERVRKAKDWAGADQLKDAMQQRGIQINQNAKSWTTNDGRQGRIPAWSELGET